MHTKFEASIRRALSKHITDTMKRHENDPVIDPATIADEICQALPKPTQDALISLHVRELLRAELRHLYEGDSHNRQLAFPDFPLVQARYPSVDRVGYIKSDLMSRNDWWTNVEKLNRKGYTLLEHSRQLEEWGRDRFPPDPSVAKG